MQTSASAPPRQWVRIEWVVDHTQSLVTIMLFRKPNSVQPTEVISASGVDIGYSVDEYQFGRSGSQPFVATFWTDGPAISSDGFLGPIPS